MGKDVCGILVVDKPSGFTSHDVVAKLRGIFKMRQIGHAGTLDPMATGVLVALLGKATRASDFLAAEQKEYIARFKLGIVTDTQDITGSILESFDVGVEYEQIKEAVQSFLGEYHQLPPMFSAIQVNGQRLYDLARAGLETERAPRLVTIDAAELTQACCEHEYEIRVSCSKGTYVRTLCHDIGQKLGCGAAMTYLRRVRSGAFDIAQAHTLEELQSSPSNAMFLHPLQRVFERYDDVRVTSDGEIRAKNGAFLLKKHLTQGDVPQADQLVCVLNHEGSLLQLGIGGSNEKGQPCILCRKSFV